MSRIAHRELVAILLRDVPQIADGLRAESGLLHMQVACLTRYIQAQIDDGNRAELARCFEIVRRFIAEGNTEVQNAVGVSLLEHLNVKDGKVARGWAVGAMPPLVKQWYQTVAL